MNRVSIFFLLFILTVIESFAQKTSEVWLDDLAIATFSEGISGVNQKTNGASEPLQLGNTLYSRGLGIHSTGVLYFLMDGDARK